MELPFYLMSHEEPGGSWDGMISLHGTDLHIELTGGNQEGATAFDVPLEAVKQAEFQRGLVCRKISLTVGSEEIRRMFPAGVSGEEVHLMVAKDEYDFGGPSSAEAEYERLVGQIETISAGPAGSREGLPG
jgi:hypothetical protein